MKLQKKNDISFNYAYYSKGKLLPMKLTRDELINYRAEENELFDDHTRELIAQINEMKIEKRGAFLTGERKARAYIRSLGFHAAKGTPISHFRATDKEKSDELMGEGAYENYYAVYSSKMGVVVPEHRSDHIIRHSGSNGIAELLSHELTHAAAYNSLHRYTRLYNKDEKDWGGYTSRQGLITTLYDGEIPVRGALLDEALAAHVGGLFARRLLDPSALLNSIADYPSSQKPDFYDSLIPPMKEGGTLAAGHDAYAMEMLSWKAHERGVTDTPHRLIEALYATALSDPEMQLRGLRAIPRIINSVKPGLYTDLRNVPLDKQSFIDSMNYVYEIVSQ